MTGNRLLFLDAETYYDQGYSLRCMCTANYILDPRFEMIMLAVKEGNAPPYIVDGPDVGKFFKSVDPAVTTAVTFNALFDMSIFSWRYGWVPSLMLDAMGMARALRGHLLASASLDACAKFFGAGNKGHAINDVKGMHRADIIANGLWEPFSEYALQDAELLQIIFDKMLPEFPASERRVMDRVLRCCVQPEFRIDQNMLRAHIDEVKAEKAAALASTGAARADLMSTPKFAKLLEDLGVEVEMKISATGNTIPALAKTDKFLAEDLIEHPDVRVQALAAARLGEKSTIEETRGERLLSIGALDWSCYGAGNFMPIPLAYGRAHTHRLAGDWKLNMQNLPSGRGGVVTKLRKSLIPPAGNSVLVADLAQIEARICAWLCGQLDLLQQFADDQDPYSQLGSKIFSKPINGDLKGWKKLYPLFRFIGKGGVLGLGFGCGADKFYNMVIRDARKFGMNMDELMAIWSTDLAQKSVDTYREANRDIRNGWYKLEAILRSAWLGKHGPVKFGTNDIVEIGHGYVLLPNGMKLNYANPRLDVDPDAGTELRYDYGRRSYKIYGAKMLENIVQALARIVVMNAALRLWDRGLKFKLQAHDELAFIVDEKDVDRAKALVLEELSRRPSWAKALPLAAEANYGPSYGDAK